MEANRIFRDAVLARWRPGDLVWVHDYHLMLLPRLLREATPEATVGFFLHIPFPASDVFRVLPRREELLHGLLGADYVAFQTHGHLQHFRSSLLRILGVASRMDRVESGRPIRRTWKRLPIGIVPEDFTRPLETDSPCSVRSRTCAGASRAARSSSPWTGSTTRRAFPERLRTFRTPAGAGPALRGRVVLVQVAVPSRERIPLYAKLRHDVNELVGEINGALGTPDWTPVVYIRRAIPRAGARARSTPPSDVGWVTPLLDGMNLVAKEYVACQRRAGRACWS